MSKSTSKNFGDAKIFLAGREQHLIIGKPSFNNIRTLMVSVFLLMATFFISAQNNNDFDDGLTKSILFYDAQICGKQPSWVRFDWRFNCHMNDGKDVNRDLTGGYHDAGDHTKFNYITAHAMRVLAWSLIDYRGSFNNTGNEQHLLRHLRWGADYMIKMHPSKNEYYSQIGVAKASPNPEHGEWVPAHRQSPNIDRSAKKITTKNLAPIWRPQRPGHWQRPLSFSKTAIASIAINCCAMPGNCMTLPTSIGDTTMTLPQISGGVSSHTPFAKK